MFSSYQLHKKIGTVASALFLTNKEVSMFALHLSQPQSQRSHDWWISANTVLTWPMSCAAGNCCAKCADFAFLLFKLTSLMAREGHSKAERKIDFFYHMWCRITACWFTLGRYARYPDYFLHDHYMARWLNSEYSLLNFCSASNWRADLQKVKHDRLFNHQLERLHSGPFPKLSLQSIWKHELSK